MNIACLSYFVLLVLAGIGEVGSVGSAPSFWSGYAERAYITAVILRALSTRLVSN